MTMPTARIAAEALASMTPEARTVAMIRRSISMKDNEGAVHTVAITAEIQRLCDAVLAKSEQLPERL